MNLKSLAVMGTVAIALLVALPAIAADYTLTYRDQNRWVAQDDAEPLRAFLKAARAKDAAHFTVALPEGQRKLSIDRLIVLRDILEQTLDRGVVIEEVTGTADANTLVVGVKK